VFNHESMLAVGGGAFTCSAAATAGAAAVRLLLLAHAPLLQVPPNQPTNQTPKQNKHSTADVSANTNLPTDTGHVIQPPSQHAFAASARVAAAATATATASGASGAGAACAIKRRGKPPIVRRRVHDCPMTRTRSSCHPSCSPIRDHRRAYFHRRHLDIRRTRR